MKKIILAMTVMALMMGFVSCNNDNESTTPEIKGEAASINITLDNNVVAQTRAFDDLTGKEQNELALSDVNVLIFNKSNKLMLIDYDAATNFITTGKNYTHNTDSMTTAASKVIIIGNAGDLTTKLSAGDKISDLNALLATIESAYTDKATKIWVQGTQDVQWGTTDANGVVQGSASITLSPMLSRVDVTVDISGVVSSIGADKYIVFNGVALLYSGAATHYTPSFVPAIGELGTYGGKYMRSGLDATGYTLWGGIGLASAQSSHMPLLNKTWATETNGKFEGSFYAFPTNNASGQYDRDPAVTVYGTKHTTPANLLTDVETKLFWPVHFAGPSSNSKKFLENGKVYKVTIKITGDFTTGGSGGGVTDPEKVNPADIKVSVVTSEWKDIVIITNVEFND